MSNQDFVYFNWGTHDSPSNPYYGLISPSANKIYVVGQNYQQLKFIQLLMLSSKQLVTTKISAINNYTEKLLDNSVCLNWSIQSPIGQHSVMGLAGDFKTRGGDALVENVAPVQHDFEIQKNIMFLQRLLSDINYFFNKELDDHYNTQHIDSLRKFLTVIVPADLEILKIVDVEQNLIEQYRQQIINIKSNIIQSLSTIDYNQNFNVVYQQIVNAIDSVNSTNDIHTKFKTFITGKLK